MTLVDAVRVEMLITRFDTENSTVGVNTVLLKCRTPRSTPRSLNTEVCRVRRNAQITDLPQRIR